MADYHQETLSRMVVKRDIEKKDKDEKYEKLMGVI